MSEVIGNGREITYLEAVREAMVQEMRRDPEVFLMGEDIGRYGGALTGTLAETWVQEAPRAVHPRSPYPSSSAC